MSPLLGRPSLPAGHAAVRGVLLLVALMLAVTPLSILITGTDWCTLTLIGAAPVILSGIVLRKLLPLPALVPTVQVLVVIATVIVVELRQGVVDLSGGPASLVTEQVRLFPTAVADLTASLAPVTVGARGTVLVVLLMALVALLLDILYLDLGWHTPTALVLMGFIVVPALQQPSGGAWWTVVLPVLAGAIVLASRTLHADPVLAQRDPRPQAGPLAGAGRTALAASLVVLLVAVLTVPTSLLLPQIAPSKVALDMDVVNAWRNKDQANLGSVMVDDSVSVRRSLLQQDPTEVLRYTTDAEDPSYLRLRTLTRFDGETFTEGDPDTAASGSEAFSDGRDDGNAVSGDDSLLSEYSVTVTDLAGDRLPAPADIREVSSTDASLDSRIAVDATSGEISAGKSSGLLTGMDYQVVAEENPATAQQLRDVDPSVLSEPLDSGYLRTSDVPAAATDLADSLVQSSGASNAFDTAVAFQDYFHNSFDYSLTVSTPPGEDPLESFLADRVGYCEQFASVFALMMTSQGYPTRVVIGFTAGDVDGDQRVVSSTNAHAWPEVWFGPEHGWVRFEPTPSAANNGIDVPSVTDESQQTAPSSEPSAAQTTTEEPTTEETTTEEETTTPEESQSASDAGTGGVSRTGAEVAGDLLRTVAVLVGAALVAGLLAAAAVVLLRRRRDARRRARWERMLELARADGVSSGDMVRGGPAESELWRRASGLVAWEDLEAELRGRAAAVRWLGWTGLWGRPPLHLRLDAARPPAAALDALLDDIEPGSWAQVTDEHREAAARIGDAVSDARYAVPVDPARWEEPAVAGGGANGSAADGGAADVGAADGSAPGEVERRALRPDRDLLVDLVRRAR
ncbi:DUF3488 and transglutaminase-like domain-containing protein [Brachybacterium squillarum]|uniref:DUF3488 and transglutaminase-like domain-containing protein n=1 Tax=Brachybacterium squillarum TaxID=661979 RepID=UPI00222234ED|nr:DUF3488 and transglutaminase-like domain-containing protein [Brachybacterium squillarum]MCW1806537.1 DUF3488 and transglutaminase-like domain-containing protein [Brachybacterium squillarum]